MTRFMKNNINFGSRVAAVCIHDGYVLLQGEANNRLWVLPGGGVEMMESSTVALKREIREELDLDCEPLRLLWVTEEFFTIEGIFQHQYGFIYLMALPDIPSFYAKERVIVGVDGEGAIPVLFRWFKLEDLGNITLYPTFLVSALHNLPQNIEHIVCKS